SRGILRSQPTFCKTRIQVSAADLGACNRRPTNRSNPSGRSRTKAHHRQEGAHVIRGLSRRAAPASVRRVFFQVERAHGDHRGLTASSTNRKPGAKRQKKKAPETVFRKPFSVLWQD